MVSTSLFTGLSGLKAHQRWMDVIGNNLANINTPGFWSSRVTFSDLLSFTITPGNGPTANSGGVNPTQLGLGTAVSSIDTNTNQGTFLNTGRPLDVAIKGRGFFALQQGNRTLYTRVGTFGVDTNRQLIDLRSGLRVIGSTGAPITVPLTGTLPAQLTSSVDFAGTLPAEVTGPLAEVLSSSTALQQGTAAVKSSTSTPLFPINLTTLGILDNTFTVTVDGGSPQTVTLSTAKFGGDTSVTAAEWKAGIESQVNGVSVDATTGAISTLRVGNTATLKMDDVNGNPISALGFNTILIQGTQSDATTTTLLNDLTINNKDYVNGNTIQISGTDASGNKVAGNFTFGPANDGTTVGDMLTFINSLYQSTQTNGATAALSSSGTITLTANQQGDVNLQLFISDTSVTGNKTAFPSFTVSREGTGPDTVATSIDIFDSLGRAHSVAMTFTRSNTDPTVWNLEATMDSLDGNLIDSAVTEIRFNANGSFNVVTGANQSIEFNFNGIAAAQTVNLNFGSAGSFDGLSMLGSKATAAAINQDGFAAGTLLNVAINKNGIMQGFFSNGQTTDIGTLRIAVFNNPQGLVREGDTLFSESPNSNNAILTTAGNANAGTLVAGVLESSNVDIAEEFVRLIEAQRGFQANARVITTADQILAELLNIVR